MFYNNFMADLPKTLIFLGPQGSGKDTQARLFSEKFGYRFIDMGTTLREIAKQETELGRKIKTTIDAGHMVEPEVATEVVNSKLNKLKSDEKVIVGAYPRGMEQYQLLKQTWPKLGRQDFLAVYIDITDEEALKRLLLRAEKEGRADDTAEAIKNRLSWSRSVVDPMVAELEKAGKLIRINGMPSIEEVHQEVLAKLNLNQND